ncbi:MAG TPA: HAD family phosphatase [Acidimicrobiales bacterium]|jgi:2-haloacid dehalogenase
MAGVVKNVVFDIGGVLLQWDPRMLYGQLIPDPDELDWFLDDVCNPAWNSTLDLGRDFDEACTELAASFPNHAELVHAWKRQDEMVAGEVPGTGEIVRRLKANGVPLYLVTNAPANVFAARRAEYEILQQFDGAVVSGEEGVLKPSPEIFERLADRYGIDPAASLFIDDVQQNVDGALAAGFQAVRFVDAESLAAEPAIQALISVR